jgi:hypothetical protein
MYTYSDANPNLHVDYMGPASSMSAAAAAAINAAGLSNAPIAQQQNWLKYGNVNGLPAKVTNLDDIQAYIDANHGVGYYNHPNDPVPNVIGYNFGQTKQYNDPNSPSYLQGATQGNVIQSLLQLHALFTTSNSSHSKYRWNDPATWPTNVIASARSIQPVTTPTNQISTGNPP